MKLQGKKIGISLPYIQLKNSSLLNQIDDLLKKGGEISIIFYNTNDFEHLFLNDYLLYKDILIIVSPPEKILKSLIDKTRHLKPNETPLVLVMEQELTRPTPAIKYLSELLQKDRVYFVPFGAFQDLQKTILHSRKDLISKTCSAALSSRQIKPAVFDTHIV